jgi:hypothetical protein
LSWQDVTSRHIARPQLDQLSAALLTAVKCMHGNMVQEQYVKYAARCPLRGTDPASMSWARFSVAGAIEAVP